MLTNDMTRLCGEILALRRMRGSLMSELQHGAKGRKQAVAELCAHIAVLAWRWPGGQKTNAWLPEQPEALGRRSSAGREKRLGWRPQGLGWKKRLVMHRRDPVQTGGSGWRDGTGCFGPELARAGLRAGAYSFASGPRRRAFRTTAI